MKREYGNRKDYPCKPIADGIYNISDFLMADCYLIIGKTRALLIDVGTGLGDLRGFVETLTDLPIDVSVTHIHPDHIGGMGQFEKIYAHSDDIKFGYKIYSSMAARKFMKTFAKGVVDPTIKCKDIKRYPYDTEVIAIEDGHVFDLGERKVSVKHLKGHTTGSVVFLDDTTKTMFVGDNFCASPWLFLPNSTSVEEWIESADVMLLLMDEYTPYWAHEGGIIKKEILQNAKTFAEEVMRNQPKNKLIPRIKFYPFNDRVNGSIVYRTSNVHKKSRK